MRLGGAQACRDNKANAPDVVYRVIKKERECTGGLLAEISAF